MDKWYRVLAGEVDDYEAYDEESAYEIASELHDKFPKEEIVVCLIDDYFMTETRTVVYDAAEEEDDYEQEEQSCA